MKISKVNLGKGFIDIYDFGDIKLHCYQTNDLMNDESYILENKENVLLVEFPAFYDNLEEFERYRIFLPTKLKNYKRELQKLKSNSLLLLFSTKYLCYNSNI